MTVQHNTLTGSDLHEPKGVAAASADNVYVANGAGSGTWQKVGADQINQSDFQNVNQGKVVLSCHQISVDAGSGNEINSHNTFILPFTVGVTIDKIAICSQDANGVNFSGEDVDVQDHDGNSMGTVGSFSTSGEILTLSPSSNNSIPSDEGMQFVFSNVTNAGTHAVNRIWTVIVDYTLQ